MHRVLSDKPKGIVEESPTQELKNKVWCQGPFKANFRWTLDSNTWSQPHLTPLLSKARGRSISALQPRNLSLLKKEPFSLKCWWHLGSFVIIIIQRARILNTHIRLRQLNFTMRGSGLGSLGFLPKDCASTHSIFAWGGNVHTCTFTLKPTLSQRRPECLIENQRGK